MRNRREDRLEDFIQGWYVYWFEHKWSRSKSSVGSYRTTWRRLYKYTKGLTNVSGGE